MSGTTEFQQESSTNLLLWLPYNVCKAVTRTLTWESILKDYCMTEHYCPYKENPSPIFRRTDRTREVNKLFIIWLDVFF